MEKDKIMDPKVLFISHNASATGAPIVLLHLLRWLKVNSSIEFEILLKNEGKLVNDFKELGKVYSWNHTGHQPSLWTRGVDKLRRVVFGTETNYLSSHQKRLLKKIKESNFDLIYANTGATGCLVKILKLFGVNVPVLCHVHELEYSLQHYCGPGFKEAIPYINHYIVVSKATLESLVTYFNIDKLNTTLVYEFIPVKDLQNILLAIEPINIKHLLSLPEDSIIVAGAGTTDWRKGTDLFVQIAKKTFILSELPIYYIWLGGNKGSSDFDKYMYDIEKSQLKGRVFLLGHQDMPYSFFASIDLFLLSSREDPFPLVCLEAATFQKPILCFESAGGIPEFVQDNCGMVVPYLSVDGMANCVIELAKNPDLLTSMGINAKEKVNEYDVGIAAEKILKKINMITLEQKGVANSK